MTKPFSGVRVLDLTRLLPGVCDDVVVREPLTRRAVLAPRAGRER
jgi:hypothetical protein